MSESQPGVQPEQPSAPDVNTASPDVPKKRRRTLVIAVTAAVLAVCLCVGFCLVVYVVPRDSFVRLLLVDQPAVNAVADRFMSEMAKKDAEAAYALFSTRAKQSVALSDLKEILDGDTYALYEGYESLSVTEGGDFVVSWDVVGDDPQMAQGTVAEYSGVVHYEGGFEGSFAAVFEREGGEWRVHYFYVEIPPDKISSP